MAERNWAVSRPDLDGMDGLKRPWERSQGRFSALRRGQERGSERPWRVQKGLGEGRFGPGGASESRFEDQTGPFRLDTKQKFAQKCAQMFAYDRFRQKLAGSLRFDARKSSRKWLLVRLLRRYVWK